MQHLSASRKRPTSGVFARVRLEREKRADRLVLHTRAFVHGHAQLEAALTAQHAHEVVESPCACSRSNQNKSLA